MKYRTGFLRGGGALTAIILLFAMGAAAETTNTLSDAEIQGRALAQKIFELQPTENLTNTGVIKIKDGAGNKSEIRFEMRIKAELTNWYAIYTTLSTNSPDNNEELWVAHPSSNKFSYGYSGNKATKFESFASSDFSADDLSLCFLYWPAQKVLPKPTNLVRGREYTLLESTNPNPSTNGYSRVLSWIDKETGGILQAEAYNANGKLLKEFAPKSFKKVNGQWELQEMEIRNVQTGSRTRLEFDLNKQ
jgi:hypothetical protein